MFFQRTVLFLLLALFLNAAAAAAHRSVLQQGIADEVVRFHVLANSDSEEDQEVKLKVRDAVLAWMSEQMTGDRSGTIHYLQSHLTQIEQEANRILEAEGMPYRAAACLCQSYFPDRSYGSCTFPAGWYEALHLRLGKAQGRNWWCILYPDLCFSDCLKLVTEEEPAKLKEALTVEEYESLLRDPDRWRIRFLWF